MGASLLATFAAVLITACAILLLVASDWRASIGLLAAQYVGVFILIGLEWPLVMAITRLIAGWMAGAVLGMAMLSLPASAATGQLTKDGGPSMQAAAKPAQPAGRSRGKSFRLSPGEAPNPIFHLLSALLVCLAVVSQIARVMAWIPGLGLPQAWGGLILIGLGLLKLGFHSQPVHVTLGLLTLFSGFEILYAAVNTVPMIAALSAGITLGIVLTGAYLELAPHMEPGE